MVGSRSLAPDQDGRELARKCRGGVGDFAVWGAKLRGAHAAIDMLLPLAAVAFGLTAIGIVFLVCASLAGQP